MVNICKYILIITPLLVLYDFSQDNENRIEWCAEKKLSLNDFKGIPITSGIYSALTKGEIKVINGRLVNNIPRFDVKCYFLKDKSWTFIKNDDYILKHEQLHFDIYEVYARKIRKTYDSLNVEFVKDVSIYQKKYKYLIKKANEYSVLYDNEVYFNEEKQKQWSLKIAKELEELKAYEVKCSCNK